MMHPGKSVVAFGINQTTRTRSKYGTHTMWWS